MIGGWTAPKGSRERLGALLVGYWEGDRLRYAGKVGTGFDAATSTGWRRARAPGAPRRRPSPTTVCPRPRAGPSPSSWRRSASPSGRATGGCATRAISACATTSRAARSCARSRRAAAGARSRSRGPTSSSSPRGDHQGRPGVLLPRRRRGDAAPRRPPTAEPASATPTDQGPRHSSNSAPRALPRLDRARHGPQEGRRRSRTSSPPTATTLVYLAGQAASPARAGRAAPTASTRPTV